MCYKGIETSRYFRKQTPEHCYLIYIPTYTYALRPNSSRHLSYILCVSSTYYFLRTFSNIPHLIFKRRIYIMQGRHYSFHSEFTLRQGVYFPPLFTRMQLHCDSGSPNLPATSHLWLTSLDWCPRRQEIWGLNSKSINQNQTKTPGKLLEYTKFSFSLFVTGKVF